MHHLLRSVPVALIGSLSFLLACSGADRLPTEQIVPEGAARFSHGAGPDLSRIATYNTKPSITIAWAKKWIGPEGGRLDFYGFAIDVPAGAVDKVTQFSIQLPVDPKAGEHAIAEFGPHNVKFLKNVYIELPYTGTSAEGEGANVLWWNESVDAWESMGGTVTADGKRARTSTPHFSEYGTEDRGGATTTSGG
jgi:hypothetical protein